MKKEELNFDIIELTESELITVDGGGFWKDLGYWAGRASREYAEYAAEYGQHNGYGT
ncbi:hypothetical protein RYH73_11095 [Olivibacter sp. CPCC 100613]|uniref:hypothetical protein n=1 Tax=Olivibacter sp. CPCC 100613 TaxID=3079931 RepID=UPI002FFA2D58